MSQLMTPSLSMHSPASIVTETSTVPAGSVTPSVTLVSSLGPSLLTTTW